MEALAASLSEIDNQIATAVLDTQGNILVATGDLKDNTEQALVFADMINNAGVVTSALSQPMKRVVVSFKNYQYALSVSGEYIVVVKTTLE